MLLETFVDRARTGACYRAANWIEIGETCGRGRQDRRHTGRGSTKRIFVRPLSRQRRGALAGPGRPARAVAPAPADWAEREFGVAAHSRATQLVSVGDREADLYALFDLAARTGQGPRLLVRAAHNRALVNEQQRLYPRLQAQPAGRPD